MDHDTYSAERCGTCAAPATAAMLDRRGFVRGAACAAHRGPMISTTYAADRFVIEVVPEVVSDAA